MVDFTRLSIFCQEAHHDLSSWFVPIRKKMNSQILPIPDKMYARLFFETGNGWYLGDSNNVPDKLIAGFKVESAPSF